MLGSNCLKKDRLQLSSKIKLFHGYNWRLFIQQGPVITVVFRNWIIVHMSKPFSARLS